jgi:hypothetical protein
MNPSTKAPLNRRLKEWQNKELYYKKSQKKRKSFSLTCSCQTNSWRKHLTGTNIVISN